MRICVADLEANGLLDTATILHCGVFKEINTGIIKRFYKGSPDGYVEEMLAYMDSIDILCMHNGVQFDLRLLNKLFGYEYKKKIVDTLLISRLHSPKRKLHPTCPTTATNPDGTSRKIGPHSVEAWGYRVGRGKVEHHDWSTFSPEMLHRCEEDVEVQHLIWIALQAEAEGFNWEPAYALTHKLFHILQLQSEYGWLLDQPRIHKNISMLTKIMDVLKTAVLPDLPLILEIEETKLKGEYKWVQKPFKKNGDYNHHVYGWFDKIGKKVNIRGPFSRICFRKVNIGSNDEVKNFLLAQGWEPQEWNVSKKTGERTSPKMGVKEEFRGVDGRLGKRIARWIVCRHRMSVLEGLLRDMRPDGRISQSIANMCETGRLTHRGIVNIPGAGSYFGRQIRKCFTSRDGYKIIGTDADGCQNRMLAARVGDPAFTDILLKGKKKNKTDIHNVNMRAINAALEEHFPSEGLSVTRGAGKSMNYGTLFGASGKKIGSMLGRGSDVGDVIKSAIFGVAPGFQALVDNLEAEWKSTAKRKRSNRFRGYEFYNGYCIGLDGRPIFISSPHMLLVYMLQSDEAIMMEAAYCWLYWQCNKRGWKWGEDWAYVAMVHDEFQAEVKEEIADEFAKLAEEAIAWAGNYYKIACEHKGSSDIGNNWCDTH